MRTYEVACVFRGDDELYARGKEAVKNELLGLGAVLQAEDDMGHRNLMYPIKKENRGHYHVFIVQMEPAQARLIDSAIKLKPELLKHLLVNKG